MATYDDRPALEASLEKVLQILKDSGATQVFVKPLAPNDNSKNQIYLGGSFKAINKIPVRDWFLHTPASRKKTLKANASLIHGAIDFSWITPSGQLLPAPDTKLILYPQYPEVRLSGFLRGSQVKASEWFDVNKSGRSEGRFLLVGVTRAFSCVGYLAIPASQVSQELSAAGYGSRKSDEVLQPISLDGSDRSSVRQLLSEIKRIHSESPIEGKILSGGTVRPYRAPNGGGYTLEAELGISANGDANPDFLGWEVKGHSSDIITLMTPEPTGGDYKDKGVEWFVRRYGYADQRGRADRMNFGGVHRIGESHKTTGLSLHLDGYDGTDDGLSPDGALQLVAGETVASEWSYIKLLEHWNKKHAQTAYVSYSRVSNGAHRYTYDLDVALGIGTDFLRFLNAIMESKIYYDPGIKLENASSDKPKSKRRSQFRIKFRDIPSLYDNWVEANAGDPSTYPTEL